MSVVNALSERLDLRIWRGGSEHAMTFRHGEPEGELAVVGASGGRTGTEVTFLPSGGTFGMTEFDFATLEHRLRELAFLNSGVRLTLTDNRHVEQRSVELHYEGGIDAFVRYLDRNKTALHEDGRSRSPGSATASASKSPCSGTIPTTRPPSALPTTSRRPMAAPIWPASGRR